MPRFFVDRALPDPAGPRSADRIELTLPESAARHVQVLRMQPGQPITVFDGRGGEWQAEILAMGRREVEVLLLKHEATERELPLQVTLVAAMPANDRFEWLVEKATELGAAAIEPVQCERSVMRLSGERALRKQQHWQAVAAAAAEQSGRNRVPRIALPATLHEHLAQLPSNDAGDTVLRLVLSLGESQPLSQRLRDIGGAASCSCYSGPEGGFTETEEARLRAAGALATRLGPSILRSETAPLAALAAIGMMLDTQ